MLNLKQIVACRSSSLETLWGHDTQIISAYDSATSSYNYEDVFLPLKPILSKPDFTIANLEVTLAGEPHKGYPQFSSRMSWQLPAKKWN